MSFAGVPSSVRRTHPNGLTLELFVPAHGRGRHRVHPLQDDCASVPPVSCDANTAIQPDESHLGAERAGWQFWHEGGFTERQPAPAVADRQEFGRQQHNVDVGAAHLVAI
eukprot:7366071-Prymnesium_polylepis.1